MNKKVEKVCNFIYGIAKNPQRTNEDAARIKIFLDLSQEPELMKREIIELGSDPDSKCGCRMDEEEKQVWTEWVLNL